jgi:hypothetical protein
MLSRGRAGYANYNDVDLDWYWTYLLLEIAAMTNYNHYEQLNTGRFLNPSSSSSISLHALTELTNSLTDY